MAKLVLNDIVSGYAVVSTYNTNNTSIETAIENTLSRDGTAPNAMIAVIDMGSYQINNLADGSLSADAVNLRQLQATTGTAAAFPSQTGNANKVLKTDGTVVGWEFPQNITESNTPAGNLAATTIQTAVNELQSDIDTRAISANTVLDGDTAGGDLTGTYPSPSVAPAVITRSKTATAHALVYPTATQTLATNTLTTVVFNTEIHDTASIHDNAVNNSRLTVPTGYLWARIVGQLVFVANATGFRGATIIKNNAISTPTYPGGFGRWQIPASATGDTLIQALSPLLPVVAGDYFEILAVQASGGNLDLRTQESWLSIELWK